MLWTRSDTLALAQTRCLRCLGLGLLVASRTSPTNRAGHQQVPCGCVLRAIFRSCLKRYRETVDPFTVVSRKTGCVESKTRVAGMTKLFYSRKNQEYAADFYLIAKRTLDAEDWAIFRAHLLDGVTWPACCRRLGLEKGRFWHAVYGIEERLGRAYRETRPYALYPVDEYFSGSIEPSNVIQFPAPGPGSTLSSKVPLREVVTTARCA